MTNIQLPSADYKCYCEYRCRNKCSPSAISPVGNESRCDPRTIRLGVPGAHCSLHLSYATAFQWWCNCLHLIASHSVLRHPQRATWHDTNSFSVCARREKNANNSGKEHARAVPRYLARESNYPTVCYLFLPKKNKKPRRTSRDRSSMTHSTFLRLSFPPRANESP